MWILRWPFPLLKASSEAHTSQYKIPNDNCGIKRYLHLWLLWCPIVTSQYLISQWGQNGTNDQIWPSSSHISCWTIVTFKLMCMWLSSWKCVLVSMWLSGLSQWVVNLSWRSISTWKCHMLSYALSIKYMLQISPLLQLH